MVLIKKIFSFFYILVIILLIIIAIPVVLPIFKITQGFNVLVVQSGSMEPTIKTGSAILVQKTDNYGKDDIITFLNNNKKETTTHRIISGTIINGEVFFSTKGDANRGEDIQKVNKKDILGTAIGTVPYLGYAIAFSKTQMGLIFLIVIPATLIIFSELLSIKKELSDLIRRKKAESAVSIN